MNSVQVKLNSHVVPQLPLSIRKGNAKQKYMAEMEVVDCAHRFPKTDGIIFMVFSSFSSLAAITYCQPLEALASGWFFKMRWGTASTRILSP